MKKLIVVLFLNLLFGFGNSQNLNFYYTVIGERGDDIGYSVKQLYDSGYVVVGSTTSYGMGLADAYIGKFDQNGNRLWERSIGGTGSDVAKRVVQIPSDSGFVFVGYSSSHTDSTGYDIWLVRTDKLGQKIYENFFGGNDWEFGTDICLSDDGAVVITANVYNGPKGQVDGSVLKVNIQTGNLIWQKFYGGTGDDELNGIYHETGKDFFVVGNTASFGEENGDLLYYRIKANGDSILRVTYGGSDVEKGNDIMTIANGDVIVVGGSASFTNGKLDAFFVKFDTLGIFKWKKNRGSADHDEECHKITRAQTSNLEESVVVYPTYEEAGYGMDSKTIFFNYDGDYYGGFDSGKFGFSKDDDLLDISPCFDKGYIEVGYMTDTVNFDKNILLVKTDSLLQERKVIYTGIKSENSYRSGKLTIFPNPTAGAESIRIGNVTNHERFGYQLFDANGQVLETNTRLDDDRINVKGLRSGLYFLKIQSSENREVFKIVITDSQ